MCQRVYCYFLLYCDGLVWCQPCWAFAFIFPVSLWALFSFMLCVSRAVCICVSAQIASFFVILFEETPVILFLESCIGVQITAYHAEVSWRDQSGRSWDRGIHFWCICYVKIKTVNNVTSQDMRIQHEKCIRSSHGAYEFLSVLAQLYYVVMVSRTASPRRMQVLSSAGRTQPVSLHYPGIQRSYQALASARWHVCSVPLFALCPDALLTTVETCRCLTPRRSTSGSLPLKWVSSEKGSHLTSSESCLPLLSF